MNAPRAENVGTQIFVDVADAQQSLTVEQARLFEARLHQAIKGAMRARTAELETAARQIETYGEAAVRACKEEAAI